MSARALALLLAAISAGCAGAAPRLPAAEARPAAAPPERPAPRPLPLLREGRWAGRGVAYGPHRDGQRPGGPSPTRAQLREDLALLAGRFDLLRLYASDGPAEAVLALVREDHLPLRVLLGAWIAPEADPGGGPLPAARAANQAQVAEAVRLARAYPDVVLALCVGNETQVSWSDHRLPAESLVGWLREARRGAPVPVATADDFGFWVVPESDRIAAEVDFVVAHVYAMWNGRTLAEALPFTAERYREVARRHAGLPVVLGEAGWATRRHVEGEQARLIRGEAGEDGQRAFLADFTAWVDRERIPAFWFEAFDEGWKGGPHPDEVEKHWGLFRADRSPKAAVEALPPLPSRGP